MVGCCLALLGLVDMAAVDVAVALAQLLVVAGVYVAITEHGLYGIDRMVNRALVYATLTPLVALVFVGVTVGVGLVAGSGSAWATALATAAAAAVFLPLRARVQRLVDRRFAARRVAAVAAVRDFAARLHRGDADVTAIGDVLGRALGDPSLRVRFPRDGELREPATGVRFAGAQVAAVVHAPWLAHEPDLLRAVLDEAAPTLAMARLHAEVDHQLAQVRASRDRVVQAGQEERRRLERDLHDGAQQRLVALGISLRRLQPGLPPAAVSALDAAVAQVGDAITELRTIAAGVRPARLDDGLRAALDDLARTSPVPVDVRVPDTRLPTDVEDAAYFILCEAVTNAVKHAAPSRVVVAGAVAGSALRASVVDDGRGGAFPRADGGGLSGMADRARAFGGTVLVTSPAGAGTRVEVVLPCGS